jgi:hypothetical protein
MVYFNTITYGDKKRELIKERKNRLLFSIKNNKYKKFSRGDIITINF